MQFNAREQRMIRSALMRQLKIRLKSVERAEKTDQPKAAHQSRQDVITLKRLIARFERLLAGKEDD